MITEVVPEFVNVITLVLTSTDDTTVPFSIFCPLTDNPTNIFDVSSTVIVLIALFDAVTVFVYPTVTVAFALLGASSTPITASDVFPTV